jgi:hypothetical protein
MKIPSLEDQAVSSGRVIRFLYLLLLHLPQYPEFGRVRVVLALGVTEPSCGSFAFVYVSPIP